MPASSAFTMKTSAGRPGSATFDEPVERTNYDYLLGSRRLQEPLLLYAGRQPGTLLALRHANLAARAGFYCAASPPRASSAAPASCSTSARRARTHRLTDEFGSLYDFLEQNGGQSAIQQLHISPLAAPAARTYEGGGEQAFLGRADRLPRQLFSQ
jgi:vitamin B12 transporter